MHPTRRSHRCASACLKTCGCADWHPRRKPPNSSRTPVHGLPGAASRHRHRHRGRVAQIPASPGGPGHLTQHPQRHHHRAEVFLRDHPGPCGVNGQDAARSCVSHLASGTQPRGSGTADRCSTQPQAPDRAVAGLRHGPACQEGGFLEDRRHRQPTHDAARGARQGQQGPLRHALARACALASVPPAVSGGAGT